MGADDDVTVIVSQYKVRCLPEDNPPGSTAWDVTVEYRGRGRWAVIDGFRCLDVDGEWDYEPIPSERDDAWLLTHRFSEEEALEWAKKIAPTIVINGLTVEALKSRVMENPPRY